MPEIVPAGLIGSVPSFPALIIRGLPNGRPSSGRRAALDFFIAEPAWLHAAEDNTSRGGAAGAPIFVRIIAWRFGAKFGGMIGI
jgi:hypothetical protein